MDEKCKMQIVIAKYGKVDEFCLQLRF